MQWLGSRRPDRRLNSRFTAVKFSANNRKKNCCKFEYTNGCTIKKYISGDYDLNPNPNLNVFIDIQKMPKQTVKGNNRCIVLA